MSEKRPTVALIHASPASVAPAKEAFAADFPDAQLWNLLDDRLVVDADAAGGLTRSLRDRMTTLITYAIEGGADAVQLSCSMYGPVAVEVAGTQAVTVLASDQAMFDHVASLRPQSVGVIGSLQSATSDSAERLAAALSSQGLDVRIETAVADGAAQAANAGNGDLLAELVATTAQTLGQSVELIVLAQYSLAPTLDVVQVVSPVPVLSPPHLAASTLAKILGGGPQ